MSRSRKKHAIQGWTTAESEKDDKRIINRALRRKTKTILKDADPEGNFILPIPDEIMSVWSMSKDGKGRVEKADKPKCEECNDKMKCLVDEDWKLGCKSWRKYQWYEKALRK